MRRPTLPLLLSFKTIVTVTFLPINSWSLGGNKRRGKDRKPESLSQKKHCDKNIIRAHYMCVLIDWILSQGIRKFLKGTGSECSRLLDMRTWIPGEEAYLLPGMLVWYPVVGNPSNRCGGVIRTRPTECKRVLRPSQRDAVTGQLRNKDMRRTWETR